MSWYDSRANEGYSFLLDCVSDDMAPAEAADATCECWSEAEQALAPVIGEDGLKVLFRQGEEVAVRTARVASGPPPGSAASFRAWLGSLEKQRALGACKAFLAAIEDCLLKLVGPTVLRRLLGRRKA